MNETWRRVVAGGLFTLAFVFNPALLGGCQKQFAFGEPELVAELDRVSRTESLRYVDGDRAFAVRLTLTQKGGDDEVSLLGPSVDRVAHACGERTFLRSADACLDTTTVPVEGVVTVRRVAGDDEPVIDGARMTGELEVIGVRLERATLRLGDGTRSLELERAADGTYSVAKLVLGG